MIEYRVAYQYKGKGYTDSEPWIHSSESTLENARAERDEINNGDIFAWVESREVSDWTQVE